MPVINMLEARVTSLQQIVDQIRAGDGPLEARTSGIYHMAGGTNTDEVCSGETAGDGTQVIKEHPEVNKKGSAGAGTPEAWREGSCDVFPIGVGCPAAPILST